MARYKISNKNNLTTIKRTGFKSVTINDSERLVFEQKFLPGLFHFIIEGKKKIVYTAPISISLSKYIKKDFSVHKFYSVIAQTIEMSKKIEMYKFHSSNLVLNTSIIHVKEITGELFFLYEPIVNRETNVNILAFLEDFMSEIKTTDKQLLDEITQFRSFLSDFNNGISETEQFIIKRYPQIYQQITHAEYGRSGFISSNRLINKNHYQQSLQIVNNNSFEPDGTTLLNTEMETTLLTDEEGTMLLNASLINGKLIRQKDGSVINIGCKQFTIGKSQNNDYSISDNRAISRRHATIHYENGIYTIVDTGSTNHTYVNGNQIEPYSSVVLKDKDVIRLADEDFIFEIN